MGTARGKAQVGDVVQVHCKATYTAKRSGLLGKPKLQTKEFLSTHRVGDTCFVDLPIQKQVAPKTVLDVLAYAVKDLTLGQSVVLTYDVTQMDDDTKELFTGTETCHRAQYGQIPEDALSVSFKVDVFRFQRDGKVYRRENRNGAGHIGPMDYGM